MATRSRTILFIQFRNSFVRSHRKQIDSSESANLIANDLITANNDASVTLELSILPPKWVDLVDEINEDFTALSQKITTLDSLHKKNVLPNFKDDFKEEKMVENLTSEISAAFVDLQKKIKRVGGSTQQQSGGKNSGALSKNIQTSLATKLQELSTAFRKTQNSYLQKLRGHESRKMDLFNAPSAASAVSGEEDDYELLPETQLAIISNEREITEREQAINEIAKSINALAVVFKDLQSMVIDQGSVLDRIDYNIEQTAVYTESGYKEVSKALEIQKKSRAKLCIIILAVIAFLLLLILFFKPR